MPVLSSNSKNYVCCTCIEIDLHGLINSTWGKLLVIPKMDICSITENLSIANQNFSSVQILFVRTIIELMTSGLKNWIPGFVGQLRLSYLSIPCLDENSIQWI